MFDDDRSRRSARMTPILSLVGAALASALVAQPAAAQGDSCQSAIAAAVARLTQCRAGAEQAFAKTGDVTRRDAAFTGCKASFDASFASARQTWGATCPDTEPPEVFNDYVAQTTQQAIQGAGGGQLATFPDICTVQSGLTTLTIQNNCSSAQSIVASVNLTGQNNPSCLQNIGANGGTATAYLPGSNQTYAFWTGSYGSATLYEMTIGAGTQDWFDISFNQGFNIGMTIVAPSGASVPYIVATDQTAPGAYQLQSTQPSCFDAPCISPNYPAPTGQQWTLYLCNGTTSPQNVNTPGPCGCSICPCSVNRGGPGCNWQDEDCKGLPVPGQGQCPQNCPNS